MSRGSSSSPSSPSRRSGVRSRSRDRHDRPICFKMEQRFRALKSPEIQESLRAALRAGATGIGEITYTKQGCTLDPPRDEPPWPSKDEAENQHPDGHDEVIRNNNDGEAGPGAEEFLVLRALGTNHEQLGQVCRHLLDLEIAVLALASKDPTSLYLVAFSNQLQQIAEVLLHEGHGLRPGNEVTGEAPSTVLAAAGLSSLGKLHLSNFNAQELELFSGAWAELEETLPELGDASADDPEKGSEAKGILQRARRLRFVSRRGLFAELHFLGESSYRVVAGSFSFEEQSADDENGENGGLGETEAGVKVSAVRKIAVDTEPMKPPDSNAPPISEMCDGELHDVTEGVSWRRITSAETPIAAAELLMEQAQGPGSKTPVFGLRAGVIGRIVCGDVSLQVVGPPRGEGLIGGTMCQSMEQLHQIERPEVLNDELQNRYEGSTGVVSTKGCITRDRGVGAAGNAKGSLLCGATPQSEIGFKTASILYSTGLMTKGGSITLESPSGSFTQVWRIRELEDNPFDSPSLRASRKVPTGPLTSPSAAAVRIASHMVPKGKGGKGKGKNKSSKGRGKPPLAAPVARQALPTGGVAFSRNTPIGSVYGTPRALTVYGVRTASTPAFTTPTPRLGSRPPGRPVASLQKDRPALRGRGMDRGRGRGAPAHGPIGRGHVTLTSAPNRRRSRSASRRRPEAQGRRRSRSHGHGGHGHGSRRSRSRSRRRGRKP